MSTIITPKVVNPPFPAPFFNNPTDESVKFTFKFEYRTQVTTANLFPPGGGTFTQGLIQGPSVTISIEPEKTKKIQFPPSFEKWGRQFTRAHIKWGRQFTRAHIIGIAEITVETSDRNKKLSIRRFRTKNKLLFWACEELLPAGIGPNKAPLPAEIDQ